MAGLIGGTSGLLISQPLDYAKVSLAVRMLPELRAWTWNCLSLAQTPALLS